MFMKYSSKEIKDLVAAWLLISVAFAILFSGGINITTFSISVFFISFIISLLTVGIGFLFHELMHKFIAQKYRLWAEFRANYSMLFLALVMSFLGFIIAAPGAVIIQGNTTRQKNGKISLAGPVTNLVLAVLFLIPTLFMLNQEIGILKIFFNYGFKINALLALFNMIPFPPFDGYKVYEWDKTIYTITVIVAGILFIGSFFV